MTPEFTDDDLGKSVVNAEGDKIGIISDVEHGTAHVEPDPGITDTIKAKLGWGDANGDAYPLQEQSVAEVTDDAVHLQRDLESAGAAGAGTTGTDTARGTDTGRGTDTDDMMGDDTTTGRDTGTGDRMGTDEEMAGGRDTRTDDDSLVGDDDDSLIGDDDNRARNDDDELIGDDDDDTRAGDDDDNSLVGDDDDSLIGDDDNRARNDDDELIGDDDDTRAGDTR
ncbi:hypothetical protein [Natronococcus wangiae]|uniref:hypothetical protein n=1 Tax=Natronococcus wangiae TaxID=3068275 RepID=UPI00273DC161|nr:hypothetical protein [Natronococcus sp. AD5]